MGKRILLALLALLLLVPLVSACALAMLPAGGSAEALPRKTEGDGWVAPQEAMVAYLNGLIADDLDQMLSAFAIETYAANYDLHAQLERVDAYAFSAEIKLPKADGLFGSLNIETRKNHIVTSILYQLMSLSYPGLDFTLPISMSNYEGGADAFMAYLTEGAAFDPSAIAIGEFVSPATLTGEYLSERNQAFLKRLMGIYGAQDIQSVAVRLEIGTQPYLLCADALRYGDKWYLSSLGGNLASLLGGPSIVGGLIENPAE